MMLFSVSKHLMAAVMPLLTHKRHKASPTVGDSFCTHAQTSAMLLSRTGCTAKFHCFKTSEMCRLACEVDFYGPSGRRAVLVAQAHQAFHTEIRIPWQKPYPWRQAYSMVITCTYALQQCNMSQPSCLRQALHDASDPCMPLTFIACYSSTNPVGQSVRLRIQLVRTRVPAGLAICLSSLQLHVSKSISGPG